MGVVVAFNYTSWVARYPEFQSVSQATAQEYFNEATLYLRNDGTGPINDPNVQSMLLNMIVAHIAKLYATITLANGQQQQPSGIVGRVSSASEGSVSLSTDMGATPGSEAWFAQTPYGFSYWAAMAPYRTMRYVGRPRYFGDGLYGARW